MLSVSQVAHPHHTDIDPTREMHSKEWDLIGNVCVSRATEALKGDTKGYTDKQRHHLADMFNSMAATNRTIRRVLEPGPEDPGTVDALALARLQVECLYALCLMMEDSKYVDRYTQDHWRKQYVKHLLFCEEVKALPNRAESISTRPMDLIQLGLYFGITGNQICTVELKELGKPLPAGTKEEPIAKFPTPGGVIPLIANPEKKRMLERLYQKYVELCSFAHGLGQANLLKIMFDGRSPHSAFVSDDERQRRFQYVVMGDSYAMSFMSIAQSTAELTVMYPNDIELSVAAANAWNQLRHVNFLTKGLFEIRAKTLLGIIA